jgi:hypothetical protein
VIREHSSSAGGSGFEVIRMNHAAIGLAVSFLVGAIGSPSPAPAVRSGTTISVRGRTSTAPSIAAAGRTVVVTWGASARGSMDIYASVSRDGAGTFGAPVRVNDVDGDASVGGEQPPHVALVPRANHEPSIIVVWTAKRQGGTRLLVARSEDAGASFSAAEPLAGGEASGNRGWEAIATDPEGHVVSVWLDHRELAGAPAGQTPMHHEGHDHAGAGHAPVDGAARAQLSKLYFSRVGDGQAGPVENAAASRAIAAGVCYCCKTAVAAGAAGSVFATWRHVYPGNVRDIAFTVSRDGGRTFAEPIRVSDDQWVLDGCPENGPTMAIDGRERIHIVWPTLVSGATPDAEPTLELFYAESPDGRKFSTRRRLPTEGVPKHAQLVAANDGSLTVVWEEQADGKRHVVVGRERGGEAFTRQVVSGAGSAVYPVVALAGDSAVVAWTRETNGTSVIEVVLANR